VVVYPAVNSINRLQPFLPVMGITRIYHSLKIFHEYWVNRLWNRWLPLFESCIWCTGHAKSIGCSCRNLLLVLSWDTARHEGWLHFVAIRKSRLCESVTAIPSWNYVRRPSLINATSWIHRATPHTPTISSIGKITERFIIALFNYLSHLFDLLIIETTLEH